ncbi:hypothetical protein SBV1_1200017 [Verrucomicrobia bacterium]|nr:hypothetical protein SBV1_1200017 [Verrucomicrobiota bacterium]
MVFIDESNYRIRLRFQVEILAPSYETQGSDCF